MEKAYEIVGEKCGRDKHGMFHCRCGKCEKSTKNNCDDQSEITRNHFVFDVSTGKVETELETLEVNCKNRVFKINGIEFGKGCSRFSLIVDDEGIALYLTQNLTFELCYFCI